MALLKRKKRKDAIEEKKEVIEEVKKNVPEPPTEDNLDLDKVVTTFKNMVQEIDLIEDEKFLTNKNFNRKLIVMNNELEKVTTLMKTIYTEDQINELRENTLKELEK